MSIRAIKGTILATDIQKGFSVTKGGLILPDDDGSERGIHPRWCRVHALGPDIDWLTVGDWILVEHGRWSRGVEVEDNGTKITVRSIDPNGVLVVADEPPVEAQSALKV